MYRKCITRMYLSTSLLHKTILFFPGSPFFTEKTRNVLAFPGLLWIFRVSLGGNYVEHLQK